MEERLHWGDTLGERLLYFFKYLKLLNRADKTLYEAKNSGGDKVLVTR